ncbi:hypothetical protein F4810DRAFT_648168 [Camillea tinctor]|nr:hypothetical protein F4810DRAFT_648168 [Camillea tinctor]
MKSTTILSSLLFTLASASPIARASSEIDVTGFTAQTNPNGDGASISFTVTIPTTSISSTPCTYADVTSSNHLPDVPMTTCADSSLRFQFRQDPTQPGAGEGRYRLVVVYTPGSGSEGLAGYQEWDASDFVTEEDVTYEGAPDFTLTAA